MSQGSASPPAPPAFGPRWARVVGNILVRPLWRVTVRGAHHVPSTGAVIVAGNHTGLLDGPLLLAVTPRPAHFLVKEAAFTGPLRFVLTRAGQIPVSKAKGRTSLLSARQVLERGGAVGIFPEGTRGSGDVATMHPGVGWLACHTQTAVVPVAILGTRNPNKPVGSLPRLWSRVTVEFGPPVTPPPANKVGRTEVSEMTEQVRLALVKTIAAAHKNNSAA